MVSGSLPPCDMRAIAKRDFACGSGFSVPAASSKARRVSA